MEINKKLADSAKALFDNYTAQSLKIPQINDNLLALRGELDRATQAIRDATKQSRISSDQIRDNVALLGSSIDKATEQARESSQSAAKLARSLNLITGCLVAVGIIQILVSYWHR